LKIVSVKKVEFSIGVGGKMASIIMSVYNEPEIMLKEAIESILVQSFKEFEFIIVLDNPSNKVLENIIRSYAKNDDRIIFIKNKKNIGLANSLNIALNLATRDLIARMDADDISCQDRIEKQVEYFKNNPEIDFIGGAVEFIDENGVKLSRKNTVITSGKSLTKLLPYGNLFNHPTWMFRKKILDTVKGYREFTSSQDYDFVLRVNYYGYRVCNIEDILLKYRIRKNSISVSKKLYQLKMSLYIQSLYRQRLRKGKDNFSIKEVSEIDKSDIENFKKANSAYENGISNFRSKKYFLALFYILKCVLISKEQRKLFYNLLMIKISSKGI
jgi:glycosyltransferase involved in cell wall biosynthesis